MLIQVIGLAGAGKTTGIREYLLRNRGVDYYDIADSEGPEKDATFLRLIADHYGRYVIAESICGVDIESTVIQVVQAEEGPYSNMRGLSKEYISRLRSLMIKPDYIVVGSTQLNKKLYDLI